MSVHCRPRYTPFRAGRALLDFIFLSETDSLPSAANSSREGDSVDQHRGTAGETSGGVEATRGLNWEVDGRREMLRRYSARWVSSRCAPSQRLAEPHGKSWRFAGRPSSSVGNLVTF